MTQPAQGEVTRTSSQPPSGLFTKTSAPYENECGSFVDSSFQPSDKAKSSVAQDAAWASELLEKLTHDTGDNRMPDSALNSCEV